MRCCCRIWNCATYPQYHSIFPNLSMLLIELKGIGEYQFDITRKFGRRVVFFTLQSFLEAKIE